MRIGILGGTFDPVHTGHLIVAEHVREALELNKVVFIPAAQPPHKPGRAITEGTHRFEMLRLATADHPGFEVSDVELKRSGVSYTVETVKILQAKMKMLGDYFLIVGSDSLVDLAGWKSIDEITRLVQFVVVTRPGVLKKDIDALHLALAPETRERVLAHIIESTPVGISSTDIRQRVRRKRSIRYLVPPAVETYIGDHHLYAV